MVAGRNLRPVARTCVRNMVINSLLPSFRYVILFSVERKVDKAGAGDKRQTRQVRLGKAAEAMRRTGADTSTHTHAHACKHVRGRTRTHTHAVAQALEYTSPQVQTHTYARAQLR